jgi:hypothetical protein
MWVKNVQHFLNNFAIRSTPPFHRHFIIHPVLFILWSSIWKIHFNHLIPVVFITITHWIVATLCIRSCILSEIGGRASGENTSASSSPTISKFFSQYRSLLIRTKQAAQRTNRPYQQLKQRESSGLFYFSIDEQAWVMSY